MKGLTHFASGVAFGTFFPDAVQMAIQNQSFILVLGGIGGILPDTLDFKFARFFEKFDVEISPDPTRPDPQAIADEIARAIHLAYEAQGKPVSLKLHTMKLSSTHFRQYTVSFTKDENPRVEVTIGPTVTMGKDPLPAVDPIPEDRRSGSAPIDAHVLQDLDTDQVIDIFGGPDMAFRRVSQGQVKMDFIPWHRRWSHSLVVGLGLGLLAFAVAWLASLSNPALYGILLGGGFCVHVLEDQLGVMGSNLFWPLTSERKSGFGWMHSGDANPNFFFVWLSAMLLIWNLNRFSAEPPIPLWSSLNSGGLRFEEFLLWTLVGPWSVLWGIQALYRKLNVAPQPPNEPGDPFQQRLKELKDEEEEEFAS